jgi:hypothetical protein
LAATLKVTTPVPLPLAPDVIEMNAAFVVAAQAQPLPAVTVMLEAPATAATLSEPGTLTAHAAGVGAAGVAELLPPQPAPAETASRRTPTAVPFRIAAQDVRSNRVAHRRVGIVFGS